MKNKKQPRIFIEPPRLKWDFIRDKAEEFHKNIVDPVERNEGQKTEKAKKHFFVSPATLRTLKNLSGEKLKKEDRLQVIFFSG